MRIDDDGLHLRQSDVAAYISCPEQYRRQYWDPAFGGSESDAALAGTSVHAGIQTELVEGFFDSVDELLDWTLDFWRNAIATFEANDIPYSRESFKTDAKAAKIIEAIVLDWWTCDERQFLRGQHPEDRLVEWNFDVPFITVMDTPVWLCGTSDLVLPTQNQVWDWKTSGRSYELWEKQRWAIQPSVYLYAAQHEGLILPNAKGEYTFQYKVFIRGSKAQGPESYDVKRSNGSFGWLAEVVTNMVTMQLKMGTDTPWPLNDHGWHCSPKWCPFFDTCKGKHVDPSKNWR